MTIFYKHKNYSAIETETFLTRELVPEYSFIFIPPV
jgi:hypothetical protein